MMLEMQTGKKNLEVVEVGGLEVKKLDFVLQCFHAEVALDLENLFGELLGTECVKRVFVIECPLIRKVENPEI